VPDGACPHEGIRYRSELSSKCFVLGLQLQPTHVQPLSSPLEQLGIHPDSRLRPAITKGSK
jgi:hypothetical protein